MHHYERRVTYKLDTEVTIADRIEAVARDTVKAQGPRNRIAIDWIRSSCQRRRPERQNVHALAQISEPFAIAGQHFKIRQTPMREQYWLGALQVGITRYHGFAICFSQLDKSCLRVAQST